MDKDSEVVRAQFIPAKKVDTVINFIQAATGVLTSDRGDVIRDVSHLVQRGIQSKLATGFAEEYEALKERGTVKKDYETTDQFRHGMSYVFDAIKGDGVIDEQRFKAMKNIFLNAATEKMSDRNSILPSELMRICSTLNTGELIILGTAYRLKQEVPTDKGLQQQPRYTNTKGSWLNLIAKESGFDIPDMVEQYETTLMQKGLFNQRSAGGNIIMNTYYHLSDTGVRLCEFMQDYK